MSPSILYPKQEIPDAEADNITTVQQAIDYISKTPEGQFATLVNLLGDHSSTLYFDLITLNHSRDDDIPGNADRNFLPHFSLFFTKNLSLTFFIPAI